MATSEEFVALLGTQRQDVKNVLTAALEVVSAASAWSDLGQSESESLTNAVAKYFNLLSQLQP
jgi:hypothetical protein